MENPSGLCRGKKMDQEEQYSKVMPAENETDSNKNKWAGLESPAQKISPD